jgi:hypothetical protein
MTRQTWYLIGGAIVAVVAWFILSPGGGMTGTAETEAG